MKLKTLLEADGEVKVRQFALHLQQALLERFDGLDIDLESVDPTPNGWCLIMTPVFERYPKYRPKVDISTELSMHDGCLVGISRRQGSEHDSDHMFFRTGAPGNSSAHWESPSDPELLQALEEKFLKDIALLVGEDVSKRATVSIWDIDNWADYKTFNYNIPAYMLNGEVGLAVAKATLDGLHVQCTAIPGATGARKRSNPFGAAKALNDFNDNVLRKHPKPRQIKMQVDSMTDFTFFIYATHEAPPTP